LEEDGKMGRFYLWKLEVLVAGPALNSEIRILYFISAQRS
jgi:hypothetical protein